MSAPIDFDAVLGADFAAQLREGFKKYGASYFHGVIEQSSDEISGRIWGKEALPRIHAMMLLYKECQQ